MYSKTINGGWVSGHDEARLEVALVGVDSVEHDDLASLVKGADIVVTGPEFDGSLKFFVDIKRRVPLAVQRAQQAEEAARAQAALQAAYEEDMAKREAEHQAQVAMAQQGFAKQVADELAKNLGK